MDVVNYQKSGNENGECKISGLEEIGNACTSDDDILQIVEAKVNLDLLSSEKVKSVAFDEDHEAILDDEEKQEWKTIFEKLDEVDNSRSGAVSIVALAKIMNRMEDKRSIFHLGPQTDRRIEREEFSKQLLALDDNSDGYISLDELYGYIKRKRRICYMRSCSKEKRMVEYLKVVAFAKKIKKWPPPFFILLCSFVQLIFFILYQVQISQEKFDTTDEHLIFDRDKRLEVWRYITYGLIHRDYEHVFANLLLQLLVGLPLEMVHGAPRISCIYGFGVLGGSLASFCFDPMYNLWGASGGVYSLIAAHLSTLILNWNEDSAIIIKRARMNKTAHAIDGKLFRILQLVAVVTFALLDTGYAFYRRYSGQYSSVSYVAHLVGSLVGLMVGLIVLKDRIEEPWEKHLKAVSWACFCALFGSFVLWNIFA